MDWSHHDSSYSAWYTLGCVLTFINAAMMTAVQHAVQYGCVSKSIFLHKIAFAFPSPSIYS